MTDRIHSITLTLDKDVRVDDAENLISACQALRGVIDVSPNVSNVESQMAEMRAKSELTDKLFRVVHGQ